MDQSQITYINSGVYNETKNFCIPFLENARRPYRQLSLIEDAIVIYRLVRAPERLVFNVDVGNMAPPKAEAYLKKLIQQYWSRKTFDMDQNDVVKKFNPQSMLDAFWFPKRAGSEGSSVSQLAGGQNLGELTDLMYFIKKLYRSLKVPTSRLDPADAFRDGSEILREELIKIKEKKIIFTNGSHAHVENVTKQLGIDGLFDGAFDITDANYVPKPHLDPYQKLIKKFDLDPNQSILIEDIAHNLEQAKNLGMKTCWLENEETFAKKDSDKAYIDYKIKNLPSFLQEINILKNN